MKYVVLDFETFYDSKAGYSLRKLSVPEYIGDKRFKVHCLGVEMDGKKRILWGDKAIKAWLNEVELYTEDYAFVMHNAFFDAAILKWHYNFVPARMLDTILIANHVLGSAKETGKSNALADLAIRLGFEAKGRLDFMDGVSDPSEEQRRLLEIYLNGDLSLTRKVLDKLLPFVSLPEVELWLIDHTLRMYADRPLILNFDTVQRAEKLIEDRRSGAISRLMKAGVLPAEVGSTEKVKALLSSNAKFQHQLIDTLKTYGQTIPTKTRVLTVAEKNKFLKLKTKAEGMTTGSREAEKFKDYLIRLQDDGVEVYDTAGDITIGDTKEVPALAKKDEEFIRLSFSSYEGISALVNARLIERSAATSQARLSKMRAVAGGLGVMPVHLVYYGAHTGRWSGGGGFNFQNLTNPDRERDPGKREIAAAIRESFEAPDGYVFIGADAAQIEARVSAWIAGQWDLLDQFKQGIDVYSAFISEVLGEDIHKPKGGEPPEVASHLRLMRHVGKEAVLALSYSMGWRKFVMRLREDPEIARLFESGEMSNELATDVVKQYREKYTDIVETWGDLNNAFFVAKDRGAREVGPIKFRAGTAIASRLPVVNVTLPSGRVLYYRDIRQELVAGGKQANNGSVGREWKHGAGQRLYGGLILENVTQAVSRDIIVESIIRAELDRKLPLVLHVHDSIVALSPEDDAEENLKWMIESLKTNPDWAGKKLVLNAEGKIGKTLVT